jgi:hypothetical protein
MKSTTLAAYLTATTLAILSGAAGAADTTLDRSALL